MKHSETPHTQTILYYSQICNAALKLYAGERITKEQARAVFPVIYKEYLRKKQVLPTANDSEEERLQGALKEGKNTIRKNDYNDKEIATRLKEIKDTSTPAQYREILLESGVIAALDNLQNYCEEHLQKPCSDAERLELLTARKALVAPLLTVQRRLLGPKLVHEASAKDHPQAEKARTVVGYVEECRDIITESQKYEDGNITTHMIDLAGLDLSHLNLEGIDLYRVNCRGTNFTGATLENGCAHDADFTGANLENCNVTGVNFTGAAIPADVLARAKGALHVRGIDPIEALIAAYRTTVHMDERNARGAELLEYLNEGEEFPEGYGSLGAYLKDDREEIAAKPGKGHNKDMVAYAKKVQSGKVKTPWAFDTGNHLNLANKLTVDVLYPKDNGRRVDEVEATASFFKEVTGDAVKANAIAQYISLYHPAVLALLSTSITKILRVDFPEIKRSGSAYAARDPQFFNTWDRGLKLIKDAKAAVKESLSREGNPLDAEFIKVLSAYEKEALCYLKENIRTAPDTAETIRGARTVAIPVMFGHESHKRGKKEAISEIDERLGCVERNIANTGGQLQSLATTLNGAYINPEKEKTSRPTPKPRSNYQQKHPPISKKGHITGSSDFLSLTIPETREGGMHSRTGIKHTFEERTVKTRFGKGQPNFSALVRQGGHSEGGRVK